MAVVAVIIMRVVSAIAIKGRANQLTIRKSFLVGGETGGLFGWHGVERVFHCSSCMALIAKSHQLRTGRAEYATTLKPVIVGPEV
jgi:hypothetical protein